MAAVNFQNDSKNPYRCQSPPTHTRTHPFLHPRIKIEIRSLFSLFLSSRSCGDGTGGGTGQGGAKPRSDFQLYATLDAVAVYRLAQIACSSIRQHVTSHRERGGEGGVCLWQEVLMTKLHSKQHREGEVFFFLSHRKDKLHQPLTATHANVPESTTWHSHQVRERGRRNGGSPSGLITWRPPRQKPI